MAESTKTTRDVDEQDADDLTKRFSSTVRPWQEENERTVLPIPSQIEGHENNLVVIEHDSQRQDRQRQTCPCVIL